MVDMSRRQKTGESEPKSKAQMPGQDAILWAQVRCPCFLTKAVLKCLLEEHRQELKQLLREHTAQTYSFWSNDQAFTNNSFLLGLQPGSITSEEFSP